MTKKLVVAQSEMKIFDAVDLITEGTIQAALPSKATSLSGYEVNYLIRQQ